MLKFIRKKNSKSGFTLIEVLLVVAAIAILAGIVIFAINPSRQLALARNDQRRSDVNTILNAVYQYSLDNDGTLPSSIGTTSKEIAKTGAPDPTGLVDLSVLTNNEVYIISMPYDPQGSSLNGAGYEILKTANNRVKVSAPDAELGVTIEVSR